ncbi:DgyrCDS12250 [Dimorphilus gyrociliatus]|uniref:DgyrCDS12250 n=1 Tax=Dimorphilus gyrociliatus TaxID=2664684 RepID=A0A7I8W7M8_9ANNE|nr:DgyrCDS12250 [Dimorphilus gyrociliatus]
MADDSDDVVSNSTDCTKKNSKPVMEKRRRARINASLCELKALLLDAMKKDGARHNKMEKADILEYTVRHLRQVQRQQISAAASSDPAVLNKFYAGFNECTNEVSRYLSSVESVDVELRSRILEHLTNCIATSQLGRNLNHNSSSPSSPSSHTIIQQSPISIAPKQEINNNVIKHSHQQQSQQQQQQQQVQVIPTKLANGQMAFVIPSSEQTTTNYVMITSNTCPATASNVVIAAPKQQTIVMQVPVVSECSSDSNNNTIKTPRKRGSSSPMLSSSATSSPSPAKSMKTEDNRPSSQSPKAEEEPWRPW